MNDKNVSPIALRIQNIVQDKKLSIKEFASQIGMSQSNLSNLFAGKVRDLGSEYLTNILIKFPEVNSRWLLTGEGELYTFNVNSLPSYKELQEKNLQLIYNYTQLSTNYQELMKQNSLLLKKNNESVLSPTNLNKQ